jgi:hypothetical protein
VVADLVLHARDLLVPLAERLDVDGAKPRMAALLQDTNQMAADEATGAGDDHKIILRHAEPFQGQGCFSLCFNSLRGQAKASQALGWAAD